MPSYEHFARHYDAVMGADPLDNGARIRRYLAAHDPRARSLLELGCGSGQILAALPDVPSLTGIDRSTQMLARARERVPRARLLADEIDAFALGERFDAVICVFDTLNHLAGFERWRSLFARARAHLHPGGLFAFDVNTVGQLRRLSDTAPWTLELAGATVTQRVEWLGDGRAMWHVVIDEGGVRRHERIEELAVPLARIAAALEADFVELERAGDDDSPRAYLAWRRR